MLTPRIMYSSGAGAPVFFFVFFLLDEQRPLLFTSNEQFFILLLVPISNHNIQPKVYSKIIGTLETTRNWSSLRELSIFRTFLRRRVPQAEKFNQASFVWNFPRRSFSKEGKSVFFLLFDVSHFRFTCSGIGTKKNEKQNTDDKNLLHGYFFPDTWDDKSTHFQVRGVGRGTAIRESN